MEDDDEFGDLYTDVFRPVATSAQSHGYAPTTSLQSRPIDPDVNGDDEEILYGASYVKNSISNSSSVPGLISNASSQEKTPFEPRARKDLGIFDLDLDSNSNSKPLRIAGGDGLKSEVTVSGVKLPEKGSSGGLNVMEDNEDEDDDNLNIVVEERDNKYDDFIEKGIICIDKQENMYTSIEHKENADTCTGQREIGSGQIIPGLSGKHGNQGGSNCEDEWGDSDESEDDLQIVLNDNNHGPIGMERMPGMDDEDDEAGEQLVIVAYNGDIAPPHHQPMVEEQEWKREEVGPGADGERKELGDAAKASGVQPKIGYSNHLYHHQPFHLQFKYVRPGAAPLPGAVPVTPGGIKAQVRPPLTIGPGGGRGKDDWRPRGPVPMQKGLHPGYGVLAWGPNAAGRGYGSGLDFTLPSHKTIFEVDIDGFEEKTWKLPGIDISDFFNFGLNEECWKDYCKQLEQLRFETTMQSKIRVYESVRTEQDYDPDLPPELAAAVGNQAIPLENANAGKAEVGPSDSVGASEHVQPPVPIGRPIPVETGSVDRLPSIDTRRPRMHDSDTIIEIVCECSNDDDVSEQAVNDDDTSEQQDDYDDIDDLQRDDAERTNRFSHAYDVQKREIVAREQLISCNEIGREDDLHEDRSTKERVQVISSKANASEVDGEKQFLAKPNESFDSDDSKQNPLLSSSYAIESDEGEQAGAVGDDDYVMDDRSFDTEREEMDVDVTTSDPLEDLKLRRPTNKQVVGSRLEQLSQENSSENGKARSRSSKDYQKLLHGSFEDNARKRSRYERDETGRCHISGKVRVDSHSHRHMKSENADWQKRFRVEDTRKIEHGGEIGSRNWVKVRESERSERYEHHQYRSQVDNNGSWMGVNYDQDRGSRQRNRDGNLKTRTEKVDCVHDERRKGEAYTSREHAEKEEITYTHNRESSSHRKRERDDIHAKSKDEDMHYVRQKEEGLLQKERGERQRDRQEFHRNKQSHEDILSRREREETRRARPAEDKKWMSHSRGKDDYKGSGRENHPKNAGRHSDQLNRRGRVEDDKFSWSRVHEDAIAHGNHQGNDEIRVTYERPGTSEELDHASDTSRLHEHKKQEEGGRKGTEFGSAEHSSLTPSKRNQDDQSETVMKSRGRTKQANVGNYIGNSSRKRREEVSSGDGSKTGRSKMERWTSHQEKDFNITSISSSSSSLKKSSKDHLDTTYNSSLASLPPKKVDELSVDDKDTEAGGKTNEVNAIVMDDKHMDTVEKLKKRSERFKLPMPSEKEAMAIKKIESEPLPCAPNENRTELEIKPERPTRKRRWTGN